MTDNTDKEHFDNIFNLAEQITGLADRVFPYYKAFAEEVTSDCITDINVIERELDYILSYCFDERILLLYKKILKKIYKQYPSVVKFYVDAYYDMFESDEGKNEEFFTTNDTNGGKR
ncbi:MAG: hypothetical protein FWG92_08070 [Leptospirales bacterium]|nr:hypothetical protein [Leptospirales bacterium]